MLNKLTKARAPGSDTDTDTFIHCPHIHVANFDSLGLPAHVGDNVCLPSELGSRKDSGFRILYSGFRIQGASQTPPG